jgi:hypothetical protein
MVVTQKVVDQLAEKRKVVGEVDIDALDCPEVGKWKFESGAKSIFQRTIAGGIEKGNDVKEKGDKFLSIKERGRIAPL